MEHVFYDNYFDVHAGTLICPGCGKPMSLGPGAVKGITENMFYCSRACLPKHNYPIELWPITGLRMVTVRT